jgi:RHS repeat-associated protein
VRGTDPTNSDPRTLAAEVLYDRIEYGEGQPNDQALNLRTRVFRHHDPSGVVTNLGHGPLTNSDQSFDYKGNLLRSTRQLIRDYKALPDWAGVAPGFEPELFASSTQYDAINRPITATGPDGSVVHPTYNEANLLETVTVNIRGALAATPFVTNIDYDSKGQRVLIEYGNNVLTSYAYDPETFRLVRLTTTRLGFPGNQQGVQDLSYTYDPIGNITHIQDNADIQNVVFFRNRRVEPSSDYTYDAIYRLTQASGREHLGQNGGGPLPPAPTSYNDVSRVGLLHPNDGNAMGTYSEQYQYDAAGNFLQLVHRGSDPANPGWTRSFAYQESSLLEGGKVSNRLTASSVSGNQPLNENYKHDLHGSMIAMPQLQFMQWDFKDQLNLAQRQAVNGSDADGLQHQGERNYYVYDAGGQRVRKSTESAAGALMKDRFYLGGFELYREYSGGAVSLQRETLHVMDDKRRIALVETKTINSGAPVASPVSLMRYQFDNHLGSAILELDGTAAIISYEEYYPYGSTSYQAVNSAIDVSPKCYRYTGKERDDETGLYDHGARYYAPWLGRWTSCDPLSSENPFVYCACSPIMLHDPTGKQERPPEFYQEQATGQESQEQVRSMFSAHAIFYKGNATWMTNESGGGYWHLEDWQITARETGTQLNMRADNITSPAAQSKKPANPPAAKTTIKQKREEDWKAAQAGMWNRGVETVSLLAFGIVPGLLGINPLKGLEVKPPIEADTELRRYELRGNYESGGTFTDTVVAASSFVPFAEIAEGASLVATKLPMPAGGMGSLGGQEFISFSDRWAAAANSTDAAASEASQLKDLASRMRDATAQEQQVVDKASNAFLSKGPQGAGTAYHELEGAAPRGVDKSLHGGAYQLELKSHWGGWMTMDQIRSASAQSLQYSLAYQNLEGLVPIRAVRHVFANPAGGPAKILLWH